MEVNKQRNGQFTTGLYSVFHWRNVFYIMEVNKHNGHTMRFIYSLPLEKRFIYNGDKMGKHWRNVFYIMEVNGQLRFTTFYI